MYDTFGSVHIPLLPSAWIDFLYAPMPLIVGMHHTYVRGHLHGDRMMDLVMIDLNTKRYIIKIIHINSDVTTHFFFVLLRFI